MQNELKDLAAQTADLQSTLLAQTATLQKSLEEASSRAANMEYNAEAIREATATIQYCMKRVGNNRMAAMSARDTRKVMAQMEDAVERLAGFIS